MKSDSREFLRYTVERISPYKLTKRLHFAEVSHHVDVPRWACVSKGNTIEIEENGVSVICHSGKAQLLPIYEACEFINIGNLNLEFVIKEISEQEELDAYQSLTQFHYRNHSLVGRRTRLIIRNYHPLYPKIVGYIELTTPFFMNKARANLLNAPFKLNGTSWESWDVDTRRKYTNLVIRIARCVIYPEFRGLGLGQLLVKHAAQFARKHWQVASLKPLFVEISADMLKFVPFAQKAGMTFIGDTEGNIERVARDMSYLLRRMQETSKYSSLEGNACGFLDQQMARANRASELLQQTGWSLDELTTKLKYLSQNITLKDHLLFRGIVSFPKPTYLLGLSHETQEFIQERVKNLSITNGSKPGANPLLPEEKHKKSWRLFQIVFLVSQIPGIAALADLNSPDVAEREQVDIIYFPTGGGKTEAYLATLIFHCFFDRLRGKTASVTAWTRFPLRLLTLQQTQRVADVIGIAEIVRREQKEDPRLDVGVQFQRIFIGVSSIIHFTG